MNFEELKSKWGWRPIRNCPGRFILSGREFNVSLEEIVGPDANSSEFQVKRARDTVVVVPISDGGVISYRRNDGSYLHTLNTVAGFERKLIQLGIKL